MQMNPFRPLLMLMLTVAVVSCGNATAVESAEPAAPTEARVASVPVTQPTFTAQQLRYFAAIHAQEQAVAKFLRDVHAIRQAVPRELVPIRWCEGGTYIGLPFGQTDYDAYTHGYRGASGGYQIVRSTWHSWRRHVPGAERWDIAAHAPSWVQDAVATAGFRLEGKRPWYPSIGCWRPHL